MSNKRRNILKAAGIGAVAVTSSLAGSSFAAQSKEDNADTGSTNKRFANKVVLITGATSGIGRATAEAFAREGAKVSFCGRRENLGKEVEAGIKEAGGEAIYIKADVRETDQVKSFVDKTVDTYGRLDIAFDNAEETTRYKLHELPEAEWDRILDTNLKGLWRSMKYELPYMLQNKSGVIINNSSVQAFITGPESGPYAATKAGIMSLTRTAALEYGEQGIRVLAVNPGVIDTALFRTVPQAQTKEGRNAIAQKIGGAKKIA